MDAFSMLINTWSNMPRYSHGFIIPFVSLYLVWVKRNILLDTPVRPNSVIGIPLIITAVLFLIFGKISAVGIAQQVSILVMITGLIFQLLGTQSMRILLLPVSYLILMIPIFDGLISRFEWPFQLLSAEMAVKALQSYGIPVHHQSNLIVLPEVTLEVAKACSGIQYLISIIAITIPLMFIFLKDKRARIFLVVLALLVGITTNWLRVILVSLWAYYGGKNIHGPAHMLQGMFVSVFGFIVLFLAAILLGKIFPSGKKIQKVDFSSSLKNKIMSSTKNTFFSQFFAPIAILLGLASYFAFFTIQPVSLATSLSDFPDQVGQWREYKSKSTSQPYFEAINADSELIRLYRDISDFKITLYIGYFEEQYQGKEIVHHTFNNLYQNKNSLILHDQSGNSLNINSTIIRNNESMFIYFYWYNINGRIINNNLLAKIYTAIDGLLFRKTNGAIVIISSEVLDSTDELEYSDKMIDFIKFVNPFIKEYISH